MAMKEDRAREGKKAQYRKMGFGPMMDSGEIDFGDKNPLLKAKKEKQKKYQNPKKDERFNAAFRSRMKKAGFKDSEIGDTRLKKGGLSGGQAKIAAKAPPTNKIDAKDFAVLRAEKAKGRGQGLQDEKVKPGKVMKAKRGTGVLTEKGTSKTFKGYSKAFEGPQNKGRVSTIVGVKPGAKIKGQRKKFKSMEEMRKAKGFKPGESASEFNKRRMKLAGAQKALAATRLGKIVLPIAAAGVAAQQYLKSKMKKKDEPKKKMGGGMMKRPMGYTKGGGADTGRKGEFMSKLGVAINKIKRDRPTRPDLAKLPRKMGGGMMMKPMGYKEGGRKTPQQGRPPQPDSKGPGSRAGRRAGLGALGGVGSKKTKPKMNIVIVGGSKKSLTGQGGLERDAKDQPYRYSYSTDPLLKDATIVKASRMAGGMMNKPMGYKSGKSVKAKCKLGRNKPTKMY